MADIKCKNFFFFLSCFVLLLFASCGQKTIFQRLSAVAEDSTLIDIDNPLEKVIHVGLHITNKPLSSQVVQIDGKEKYLLSDLDHIYIYDWESGNLEDSISTKACGNLTNFSGFNFNSIDNILVYAQPANSLFIINNKGEVKHQYRLPIASNTAEWLTQPVGHNYSRPQLLDNGVLISGTTLGPLIKVPDKPVVMAETVSLKEKKWSVACGYPNVYYEYNWGSNYLDIVSTAKDSNGDVLFSLPIMEEVFKYKNNFSSCDTLYMRSRYDFSINSCNISMVALELIPSKEKEYYVGQHNYGEIFYDEYRDVYLRIAKHPLADWEEGKPFPKPFSIIMADKDGNLISESKIINASGLYTNNMHVCKDGLAVAQLNKDENNIYFNVYPIKK